MTGITGDTESLSAAAVPFFSWCLSERYLCEGVGGGSGVVGFKGGLKKRKKQQLQSRINHALDTTASFNQQRGQRQVELCTWCFSPAVVACGLQQ